MSKIKKRFVQFTLILSAFFASILAKASVTVIAVIGVGTLIAGGIAYLVHWFKGDPGAYPKIIEAFGSINGGCWFCPVFETLFNSINTLTVALAGKNPNDPPNTLNHYSVLLLELGLLFYILFKVLKAVVSLGEINVKEFFMDLLMPILKCSVAIAVLWNLGSFYKQVINPLIELSIGFAINIQANGSEAGLAPMVMIDKNGDKVNIEVRCEATSSSGGSEAKFGPGVNDAIQCFLQMSSVSLIQYMALGATFIADSFELGYKVFPKWSMFGVGLCLFIGCFGIFLAFPFKLVDGMFKLMFVSALMPLWVVLWILPATRNYSQTAFKMFLNVMITFICLSVVLLMVLSILSGALGDLANDQEFWQLLMAGDTEKAFAKIDWSTGTFFTMLSMTFLALSLSQKADSFAGEFGGGGSIGMGEKFQALSLAGASLAVNKVGKPLVQKTAGATGDAIKAAPRAAGFVAGRLASAKEHNFNPFRKGDLGKIATAVIPGAGLAKETVQKIKDGYKSGVSDFKEGYSSGGGTNAGSGTSNNNSSSNSNSDGAQKVAEKAQKEAEQAQKTAEETKRIAEQLGASSSSILESFLKDPTKLGAVISAVSGGSIPAALATAGIKSTALPAVNETLANGNTKESQMSKFTDSNGALVQQNVDSVIRDRAGAVLSTISRRELIDPETKKAAAIEIEQDVNGKMTGFVKEVKDEAGKVIERVKFDPKAGKMMDLLKN